MNPHRLGLGDVVDPADLFPALDARLRGAGLAGRSVHFTIDGGPPVSRRVAEAWVRESAALGYPRIRYVFRLAAADEPVRVDLFAASEPPIALGPSGGRH